MNRCEMCHENDVEVHLTLSTGQTICICQECHANIAADYVGLDLIPFKAGMCEFTGIRGKKHKFHISRKVHSMGISYEAQEVTGNNNPGFSTAVLGSLDCDQQLLYKKLENKIKKIIFKRYLKSQRNPYGGRHTRIKDNVVVGRIIYDENQDSIPGLVIDGKLYSWDELGRMLMSYEGFQFKLKIYDICDPID